MDLNNTLGKIGDSKVTQNTQRIRSDVDTHTKKMIRESYINLNLHDRERTTFRCIIRTNIDLT